ASALDGHAPAPRMAEWRHRADLLRGRSREPPRPPVRCRMVRRTGEVALCRSDLRHAAVRLAHGSAAAPIGYDDAAANSIAQAADCRPADPRDPGEHAHEQGLSCANFL